ncbi:prephenate dehydrogenase [Fructobacillus ficulneus]|uniref:Prephenate dehydrogenase n=1 Tax=Fructobacillus ficulneus TaxID=157463 RepID=A0A0K8MG80_9LACO|nr:prephenate dehydrogenase/arogenate dehydrogenase family protein [Fructobacillus ficulneus]GAO99525.1 prephenate dehydrogenase [Fructobacillus ficulneus]
METVFINGLGLIGATMARIIKASNPTVTILATDFNQENLDYMVDAGVVTTVTDFTTGASQADLIILATPVSAIRESLNDLATMALKPGVLVTDVGSSKESILAAAQPLMAAGVHFLGGHPMAGSHLTGSANGRLDLLANHSFFLINGNATPTQIKAYQDLLGAGQLHFSELTASQHDQLVSATSHLPHAVAFALANAILPKIKAMDIDPGIPAGGLLDTTRIAKADPDMWTAIFTSERADLLEQIDGFQDQLDRLRTAIANEDQASIHTQVQAANQARRELEQPR